MDLVSKLHPIVSNGNHSNNDDFIFNKDADTYMCKAGHLAKSKKRDKGGKDRKNERVRYMFDVEKCKVCPFQEGCYQEGAKTNSYYVTIESAEHKEQMEIQKNSELKNRHGYKKT